jgi:hypothetical protein
MNEAQRSSGNRPFWDEGFVNPDYHWPDQEDREDLRYLDSSERRGGEPASDDREPAHNDDNSHPTKITAHDDSSLRPPNSASWQTHAPGSELKSITTPVTPRSMSSPREVVKKLTPTIGRKARVKKAVPGYTCEICRPPKVRTYQCGAFRGHGSC